MRTEAPTIPKILFDAICKMARVDHDFTDALSDQVFNDVLHYRLAKQRNHRLGCVCGEWVQSGPAAGGQDDGFLDQLKFLGSDNLFSCVN